MKLTQITSGSFWVIALLHLLFSTDICIGSSPGLARTLPSSSTKSISTGDSVTFKATGSDSDGNLSGVTWYAPNGANANQYVGSVGGNGSTATFQKVYAYNSEGTFQVSVEAFDSDSAYSDAITWTITVTTSCATPTLTRAQPITATRRVSTGASITFSANGQDDNGNLSGVSWYAPDGTHSNQYVTSVGGTGDSATFEKVYTFDNEGNYTILVQAFDTDENYSETTEWSVTVANKRRGLYVDKFDLILANPNAIQRLLLFTKAHGFDYLVLYDIHKVFNSSLQAELSVFINLAKAQYGVREVGIAGETEVFFDQVEAYNLNFTGKCDVLNLEYEYWNNSDFGGFIDRLTHMRTIANLQGLAVEAYIGWLNSDTATTASQAESIASLVDRLLVHAYRAGPDDTYAYSRERLRVLAGTGIPIEIWPIFSAEHPLDDIEGNNFMGNWFSNHNNTLNGAENKYTGDFQSDTETWTNSIAITGFQYFTYSVLEEKLCFDPNSDVKIDGPHQPQ